jgi:hypothetical protein
VPTQPASPPAQHECTRFELVTISDINMCHVLRYLRLCDGRYFGGNTYDRIDGFEAGIHVMRDLKGMLDLVARVANSTGPIPDSYTLGCNFREVRISREMNAKELAEIFACDEQLVRDHFAPLVSLT